ncbi:MAG: hypothetical protein V3V99_03230 [candidate division Zixibacteria bacterium]
MHLAKDVALDLGLMISNNISGRTETIILTPPVEQASYFYFSSEYPKFDGLMKTKLELIWFF